VIPQNGAVLSEFTPTEIPSNTFRLDTERNRLTGFVDKRAAVEQAVYLILNIERYSCDLLSTNYGVELRDLIGRPLDFCEAELPRRITEALTQDSRVTSVNGFTFEHGLGRILARFAVNTVFGGIDAEREVIV